MQIRNYLFRICVTFLFLFLSGIAAADIIYETSEYDPRNFSDTNYSYNNQHEVNQAFQEPQEYTPPPRKKHAYRTRVRTVTSSIKMPGQITGHGEKVLIVDPRAHAWGAYSSQGQLLRSGRASAGANWCSDIRKPCRTRSGTFRIFSLGDSDCFSKKYPLGEGGAPMPYCMYFNGGQGLHGSYEVGPGNLSHGCVRIRVGDAEWIRYNFARMGTKVVVRSY